MIEDEDSTMPGIFKRFMFKMRYLEGWDRAIAMHARGEATLEELFAMHEAHNEADAYDTGFLSACAYLEEMEQQVRDCILCGIDTEEEIIEFTFERSKLRKAEMLEQAMKD